MLEKAKVMQKWQIVIPKDVRRELQLEVGDRLFFTRKDEGYLITKAEENEQICPCCNGTGRCKIKKGSDSS